MDKASENEFREYVAARQGALFRVALLLTGHREDAEDLLQTALAKLAARWIRVNATGSPDAYVRRILYNQRISWWRSGVSRREYLVDSVPELAHADDPAASAVLRIAVAKALGRLTAKQRAVIVLRFFEDLPEAEIAAILGCSVGNVRSQTHRTLERLRVVCPELHAIMETA
jgi:RNA polymerase sigma-70 factor (sigma-E family)